MKTSVMLLLPSLVLTVFVLPCGDSLTALPQTAGPVVTVEYAFPEPVIDKIKVYTDEAHYIFFDRIMFSDTHQTGREGSPQLPYRNARIMLPPETVVDGVSAAVEGETSLGILQIAPAQEPITITEAKYIYSPPDPAVYNSKAQYPELPFQVLATGKFRGFTILNLKVFPAAYKNPSTRQTVYYKKIKLFISTRAGGDSNLFRGEEEDFNDAMMLVDNPQMANQYRSLSVMPAPTMLAAGDYDMIIVSASGSYLADWRNYAAWRSSQGIRTGAWDFNFIDATYTGIDRPERLRNFIIDAYKTWGIKYVLIADNNNLYPSRPFRAFLSKSIMDDIPTDLYYSALDGTWDADGDGIYGELTDNPDWYGEVYVGRVTAFYSDEMANFFNKVKDYESRGWTSSYMNRVLLLGGDDLVNTSGEYFCEDLVAKSFPSSPASPLNYSKIYIPPYASPCRTEVVNEINTNTPHIVFHSGHGGRAHLSDMLESSDLANLTNDDYFLVYSTGCYTNEFDYYDAISEELLNTYATGAFAYIGNTRYGFYSVGYVQCDSTSSSHEMAKEFFRRLYEEGYSYRLGYIFQKSKEVFAGMGGKYFYSYYSLNMLGDPATKINVFPDLLIRDYLLDDGRLPSKRMPVQNSPDIVVDAPPYALGMPDITENPTAGVPNRVYVRVSNIGIKPAKDIIVKLYSTATESENGRERERTLIGSAFITSIAPSGSASVFIGWTPKTPGHLCLVINAESKEDPIYDRDIASSNNIAAKEVLIKKFGRVGL